MYENTEQNDKKQYKEDPLKAALLASLVGAGGTATYDALSEVPHSGYDIAKRALIGGAISGLVRYGSTKYLEPTIEKRYQIKASRLKPKTRSAVMNKSASGAYKMHKLFFKSAYTPSSGAMTGALAGAGIGGLGNVMFGDRKKSLLRRALMGGAIGGGLGGGLGYFTGRDEEAAPAMSPVSFPEPDTKDADQEKYRKSMMVTSPQSPAPITKKYRSAEEAQEAILKQELGEFEKKNPNAPKYTQISADGKNLSEKEWTATRNKNIEGMRQSLQTNINMVNQAKADAAQREANIIKNKASDKLYDEIVAKNTPRFNDPLPIIPPEAKPKVIPPNLGYYDKGNQNLLANYEKFKTQNPYTDSYGNPLPPSSGGAVPRVGASLERGDTSAMRKANEQTPLR
jgi:hypothetical protein